MYQALDGIARCRSYLLITFYFTLTRIQTTSAAHRERAVVRVSGSLSAERGRWGQRGFLGLAGEARRDRGWRRRWPGGKAALSRGSFPGSAGAGSALAARRAPAALVTFARGLGPSCSPGLSALIYYSARLDCLIAEMCSSLHQRASSFGGKKSVWTAIPRLHSQFIKKFLPPSATAPQVPRYGWQPLNLDGALCGFAPLIVPCRCNQTQPCPSPSLTLSCASPSTPSPLQWCPRTRLPEEDGQCRAAWS